MAIPWVTKRFNRRDLIANISAVGAAGLGRVPGPAAAQSTVTVAPAATSGVNLLRTFYLENALPVAPTRALPGSDWRQVSAGPLVYLIPPTWTATSPSALTDPGRHLIDIAGIALTAPKASAAWLTYLALSLAGGTADQAATFGFADLAAKLFPATPSPVTPTLVSVERNTLLGATITFVVARWGTTLAVVRGASHVSGSDAVFYDAVAAAEASFTGTTRSVFLPLVYEHLGGGGGTPTADADIMG